MKQLFIFTATILACMGMRAQETGIDSVLRQIEANNKELQANAQLISSQKLESRTENNLPDPTLSYAHLWDSKNSGKTVGEMVVSQSFDFPTLYITRGKMNRLKTGALDAQAATMRQQILLQAKEVCLDIIMLQHQQELLDARLKNAEELAAMYAKRLATGDANALETNKINLELLNVRTESRMNSTALNNKIKELLVLNGNQPLTPGRPFPDGPAVPTTKALGLTDYPWFRCQPISIGYAANCLPPIPLCNHSTAKAPQPASSFQQASKGGCRNWSWAIVAIPNRDIR